MATSPSNHATRPLCPQCLRGYGAARVVTLKGPTRNVTYVCDQCSHEWDVPDEPKSYKP
jgi:hypothetical protein